MSGSSVCPRDPGTMFWTRGSAQALSYPRNSEPTFMAKKPDPTADPLPPLCARCAAELRPGTGSFYQVNIEAVADPTPPIVSEEDLAGDVRKQIEQLLAQMQDLSP